MQQHENLCRAYFKDVRKSGRTIREDWPEYWDYARRRGSIYGTVVGLNPHTGTKRSTASTAEMFSEHDRQNLAAAGEEKGARSPSPRVTSASPGNTNTAVGTAEPPRSTTPFSLSGRTPTLFKRASRAPTVIPRSQAIARQDLIASAERIFYRYLSPAGTAPGTGESHEIYLPPALRVHAFPLSSGHEPKSQTETSVMAQVPDMFHAQKEYCYRAMEQDAFPRFLRAKAFGNLTPVSALVRLIAGLIILWIGLATGFSLIFLDVEPKSKRFFVSVSVSCRAAWSGADRPRLALHSVHARRSLPYFAPVRARPGARLLRPIRVDAVPHAAHPGAVRQEAPARARDLGLRPRRGRLGRADDALLGRARPPAVTAPAHDTYLCAGAGRGQGRREG